MQTEVLVHTHCTGAECRSCGEWWCEDDLECGVCHPCHFNECIEAANEQAAPIVFEVSKSIERKEQKNGND